MRYQTEMMNKILTNEKAQEIIDYVSQIYGESYVGLWIYQAIGSVLDNASKISNQLMNETLPTTTTLLIDYWENEFGLTPDPSLTIAQRQQRLVDNIKSKGAITPAKLEAAVSASLGGVSVEVYERTGSYVEQTSSTSNNGTVTLLTEANTSANSNGNVRITSNTTSTSDGAGNVRITSNTTSASDNQGNITITSNETAEHDGNGVITLTSPYSSAVFDIRNNELVLAGTDGGYEFTVNIQESVESVKPAIATIERLKPAHLNYVLKSTLNTDVQINENVAIATTLAVFNTVTVGG